MNIFLFELKRTVKLLLVWGAIWFGFPFLTFSIYEDFAQSTEILDGFVEVIPEGFASAFSFDPETYRLPEGFFATEMLTLYILAGSILGGIMAANIIAKEDENRSLLLTLTRPVSKFSIFLSKSLVVYLVTSIANAIFFAGAYFGTIIYTDASFNWGFYIPAFFGSLLIQHLFTSLTLLLSIVFDAAKATGATVLLSIFSLIIDGLSGLDGAPGFIKYITPFHYLDMTYILKENQLQMPEIVFIPLVSVFLFLVAAFIFNRKDFKV